MTKWLGHHGSHQVDDKALKCLPQCKHLLRRDNLWYTVFFVLSSHFSSTNPAGWTLDWCYTPSSSVFSNNLKDLLISQESAEIHSSLQVVCEALFSWPSAIYITTLFHDRSMKLFTTWSISSANLILLKCRLKRNFSLTVFLYAVFCLAMLCLGSLEDRWCGSGWAVQYICCIPSGFTGIYEVGADDSFVDLVRAVPLCANK